MNIATSKNAECHLEVKDMTKPKYPHMRIWEEQIMDSWHAKNLFPAKWSYDVPLKVRKGDFPTLMSENEKALWNRLTSKRIDAVAETPSNIYVIEIKDRLRPSAVGQALTYKTLYEEQFKPEKPVIATILTKLSDPDMKHVCDVYNIEVWMI